MKSIIKIKKWAKHAAAFGMLALMASCKKFIEVNPPVTNITASNVYSSDATAISAITSIYANIAQGRTAGFNISLYAGLSADEFSLYDIATPNLFNYYRNTLSATGDGTDVWNLVYPNIYVANEAIAGIEGSSALTPAIKSQLLGEAKFARGFLYFYLTNLYGDVPLILSTDYKLNSSASRTKQEDVYKQIVTDLKDAENGLSDKYLDGNLSPSTTERLRPTKWAAAALLARVYLYTGDWADAEMQASELIENSPLFNLSPLPTAFLRASAGNNEAIWQVQQVLAPGGAVQDAVLFILPNTGPSTFGNPVYLSNGLLSSFEAGDLRKANWVDSINTGGITYFYPSKYKVNGNAASANSVEEYAMVFRLAEQYLIRAEARAELNKLSDAAKDLNVIRKRAGLAATAASTQTDLLSAIYRERRVELFSEWGPRWFDLKRTGLATTIMPSAVAQKGGTWSANILLYPVPYSDIQQDANLSQNPGY